MKATCSEGVDNYCTIAGITRLHTSHDRWILGPAGVHGALETAVEEARAPDVLYYTVLYCTILY